MKVQISEKVTKIWPFFHSFFWHDFAATNYKWKMGQVFVAFSEYLKFKPFRLHLLVQNELLYFRITKRLV